jgi:hypothetical protein
MSEFIIKLAGALPKGEGVNGFDDEVLADDLWTAKIEGRSGMPRVAIVVYGVKEAKADKDGNRVVVVEALRVQPVKMLEGRRAVETVLLDEYTAEHGDLLPFDVKHITKAAFADLPRDTDEIDQEEEHERETMSPSDELRRHLERVHGREDAHLLTDGEAEHRHGADHDGDLPGELAHERDWIGWTRADIEAATSETDGDPHTDENVYREGADVYLVADDGDDTAQLPLGETAEPDDNDRAAPAATFSGTAN